MILVDDVVAAAQVGEALERLPDARVLARRALAEDLRVREEDDAELARDEAAARRRDREAQRAVARQRLLRLELLGLDLAQEHLRPERLAAVRERDDHAVSGLDERAEVALGLGQAARGDRGPLRLERVLLAVRKLVELDHAGQRDLAAELLAPQLADVRVLPHEIDGGQGCD